MTVLRSGSASDVGRVRTVNQDLPLVRPDLYAVADGMGGHVGGEVAARVAVETLEQAFERVPTVEGLREAFSDANAAVWRESQSNRDLRGMGTTLTAVALVGGPEGRDVLALANVGDSRAYVFSGGEITQVTDDHSLAEERMRHGEMSEEEAAVHPQRHILTRALGVSAEVEADMWELEVRTGDRVLLCSDGLTNEVGTEEIAGILGEVDDPEEAAQRLVDVANEHGGADNITVVVVDVQVGEEGDGTSAKVTPLGLTVPVAAATAAVPVVGPAAEQPSASGSGPGSDPDPGRGGQAGLSDATAMVPAVGQDETLAPGSRLAFGDEPATLAETGPRSDEFFMGTAASVPVARSTTRVPTPARQSSDGKAAGKGKPRGAPAPSGYPAPHHSAGDRVRHPGGGGTGGGLLRPQVVRLRQLDRDGAGRADRGAARSARRGPVVSPQSRGQHRSHDRTDHPQRSRPPEGGCPAAFAARRPGLCEQHHHDDDNDGPDDDDNDNVPAARGHSDPAFALYDHCAHHDDDARAMTGLSVPRRRKHPA